MGLPGRQRPADPDRTGVRRHPRHEGRRPRPVRRGRPYRRRARRAVGRRRLADAPHRHRAPRRRHRAAHRRAGRAGGRPPRIAAGERLAMQGLAAERRCLRPLAHHVHRHRPDLLSAARHGGVATLRPRCRVPRLRRRTGSADRGYGARRREGASPRRHRPGAPHRARRPDRRTDERYAGDDPNNIVNRLSPCGGIQIEQGSTPRDDHAIAIADAVADVLRPRSRRDLEWLEDTMAQLWAGSGRSPAACAGDA